MSFWSAVGKFFLDVGTAVIEYAKNNPVSFGLQSATLIVGVKGFMQAKQMMAKGQDILANKTSAGGKLPVIYGTRRVGAQIVYMDVSANDSRDLYVVYALSVGECDEIIGRTIELDGNPLTDSARFRDGGYIGSDRISSGSGSLNTASQNGTGVNAGAGQFGSNPSSRYRYVMNLHHGQATQLADPMLVASMPNWTTAHKLNGVAYIAAHYGYDKEGIWSGVPQLTVQVRGKKVFDPRDTNQTFGDVSTYQYSDNPALTFLDYITNNEYGKGLTQSQINMSTFSSAANVCDTQVDQPYFNGSAQPLTWSGSIGDDFITIGGTNASAPWWQNKIGEQIYIYDANGDGVIDGADIKEIQRNQFYDENEELIVYIDDILTSTYSSQTGSSLVKVKRFHCNGYLDANKNVMDNAKELLANMRGIFLYIDGKYELSIEDTGTSTFNITDDHIISDTGISVNYGKKDKKANKVIVEFYNANKKYELDTATVLHDASPEYYSDDGDEILEIKAEFPYISDPYIAYNMGKAILTRSRKQMTIQFLGTPEMYKLNVGDIVTLSYVGTFDTVQTCRVEALELEPNGLVAVSLIEYFDVYTWETPPEEPLEELANLPSAYAVKAPTGLSFTDTDSSSTGRPFLSWNEPTDFPDYQYRVNVVDGSGNQVINRIVDVENCDLNFVPTGSYVASVTSLNTLGTESNPARFPTTGTFTIGDAPAGTPDIKDEAITVDKLGDGSVTNVKVQNLSADKINTGELNLGQASGMAVRQTKTGYTSTATGFWLGNDGGTPKFNIGTSTNYLKFDGTDLDISGEISATTGEIGGFTIGTTSLTNTAADSKIQIGSGSDVFTVDGDGIYLGNTSFASAPFKALNTGEVQTTKSFTAGVAGSGEIAKMAGTGDYRFWSGNEAPANASFSVDKAGKVIAKNLVLKLTDGTVYFDSQTGFSNSALSQISLTTGTKVSTISNTFDADTEYEEITVTEDTDVNVSVSIDTNFGGSDSDFSYNPAVDGSENDIPDEFTLTIQHSSDGGSNYTNVLTDTFTRVNDRQNPKTTPAADEYKINTDTDILYLGDQGGIRILASTTTSLNLGCVDADGRTTLTTTGLTLTGISTGTTHRIKATVSTTDTSYDTTNNNVSSTAPRVISVTDPSGDGFYVGDGSGSTVAPSGDITRVQITTASNSGLTGGANFASGDALFSLALGSTFAGNKTFSNNVVIQGNLDVQGTTTTIDTTNLDVKDKNITLNYGTGDTSANANGAGFTIQDAVSAGNDASLTWTTANDTFNLSHPLSITGALTLNNTAISGVNQLAFNDPGVNEGIEWTGGNTKIFESPDNLTNAAGNLQVVWGGTRRLTVNNSGIDVNGNITASGNVTATAYYGDGSNLTGVTSTTINNNADNRIVTGSGTANTLNAESGLTYNGSALSVTGTISSGRIAATNGIEAQGIWINNNQPSSNNAIYSGYGAIGNRGTFYITNSGNVQIGNGAGHNANPAATFTTAALILGANRVLQMNGTTIVDASRNIFTPEIELGGDAEHKLRYSIGSIISGGTTHTTVLQGRQVDIYGYDDIQIRAGSSDKIVLTASGSSKIQLDANTNIVNGILKIGGSTFADQSRNITAGTINSGAITVNSAGQGSIAGFRGDSYNQVNIAHSLNTGWGMLLTNSNSAANSGYHNSTSGANNSIAVVNVNNDALHFGTNNGLKFTIDHLGNLKHGTSQITIVDTSRNLTNIVTISSGNITLANNSKINLWTTAGASGTGTIHMPRGGAITFYGDESLSHSISSKNSAGAVADDLRINSYGAVNINLDSNNNNSSAADFLIGRHGGVAGTLSDFFRINGETAEITTIGAIRQTISNVGIPTNYSSFTMEAADAQLDLVSSSAGTWGSAINFVEGASTTANTNNWSIARKTSGGGNTLNFNFGIANQHDNTTRMTFASDGAITATGFITGTRLRVGDGNDGYFYSDTNGRTAFSSGDFYLQTSVNNFYNYATNTYMGNTSGDTIHFRGNVITADNWGIPASGTITSTGIRTGTAQARVKLGVWSGTTYGIGMQSAMTYGGLNDYAMTFQFNSESDRGFWWGDSVHTNAQGAMALTTNGLLTVASGIRVGYGETDTTIPSAGLDVNGTISAAPIHILGATGGDKLAYASNFEADGANIQLTLERTSSGWGGIGASGNNAFMVYSSSIVQRFGVTQAGSLLANGGTEFLTATRDLVNIGTIQTNGDVLVGESGGTAYNSNANGVLYFGDDDLGDRLGYSIGTKRKENIGGNYTKLNIDWHTGITLGASQTYGGVRFFDNSVGYYNSTTKLFSVGEGSSDVKVYNDLQVDAGIKLGSSATRLSQSGVQLKIQTTSGYCEIGPSNSSWMHFETDRARFYFNTLITVDSGIVQSYDEDLILRRAQNSAHQLTVGTTGITATGNLTLDSTLMLNSGGWYKQIRNPSTHDAVFGTWTASSGSNSWGNIKVGAVGYAYTDTANGYKQYNIPTGAQTAYMSQLKWHNCGYVDVHGVQTDGDLVFLCRVSSFQDIENSNHGNVANHDGQEIRCIGTRLGTAGFTAIRITNRSGRFHFTGIAFSNQNVENVDNGIYRAEQIRGGALTGIYSVTTTNNITAYSDRRLKENIQTLDSKKALQMRGVSFIKDGVEGSGVIAQEIEEIAPELVMTADDEMGTKSVAYGNLVGYLIETVKDQQKQIDELKQRLDNGSS